MDQKITSSYYGRRDFISKMISGVAASCFGCKVLIAGNRVDKSESRAQKKFLSDSGMNYEQVFNFAFRSWYIRYMKGLESEIGKEKFLEILKKVGWTLYEESTIPKHLGLGINTKYHESYPCLTENGNLYFFSRRPGGFGDSDLYMSEFKNCKYQRPVNLGRKLNTKAGENCPQFFPDGKYFFFNRYDPEIKKGNMYWVNAEVIEDLRPRK